VLEWADIPASSALFVETREEAVSAPRGSFRLTVCRACALAFNADFDPRLPEYSARNLETQLCSDAFQAFARGLARSWIAEYGLEGARVLEIGAGRSGEFLRLFCSLSGGTGIGLDPAAAPADNGSVRLVAREFDETWREPADAVVCRHTLEHVGAVSGFLAALARWGRANPEAVYLFELPDFSTILERGSFWDLYYEHASYFTGASLRGAFERHGFEVLSCRRAFDDQYLILEARRGRPSEGFAATDGEAVLAGARKLAARYAKDARAYVDGFRKLAADGPVLVWQAGAKAAALLRIPGLAPKVEALVDVNPEKRGRYLVGPSLPIVAPEDVPSLAPAHIVVMNDVYREEIATACRELGVDAAVHSVEALRFPARR
jgi:methyltransferase family protein/C-methyltransferase-like protein